jgi:hypothetical protein
MDPLEAVKVYVGLADSAPDAHDEELAEGLVRLGLSRDQAERIVAFVPLAFRTADVVVDRGDVLGHSRARFRDRDGRAKRGSAGRPQAASGRRVDCGVKCRFTEPLFLRIPIRET